MILIVGTILHSATASSQREKLGKLASWARQEAGQRTPNYKEQFKNRSLRRPRRSKKKHKPKRAQHMRSSALRSIAALAVLASHVASASDESSHRLRGSFESDVIDAGVSGLVSSSISRELKTDCVAGSVYLGCFKDRQNARAMEFQVPGKDHSAATCEAECSSRGYTHFGRECTCHFRAANPT